MNWCACSIGFSVAGNPVDDGGTLAEGLGAGSSPKGHQGAKCAPPGAKKIPRATAFEIMKRKTQ